RRDETPGREGAVAALDPRVHFGAAGEAHRLHDRLVDRAGRVESDGHDTTFLRRSPYRRSKYPASLGRSGRCQRPARVSGSADAGEGVADEQVDDPGAAEGGLQLDDPWRAIRHVPDDRSVRA